MRSRNVMASGGPTATMVVSCQRSIATCQAAWAAGSPQDEANAVDRASALASNRSIAGRITAVPRLASIAWRSKSSGWASGALLPPLPLQAARNMTRKRVFILGTGAEIENKIQIQFTQKYRRGA